MFSDSLGLHSKDLKALVFDISASQLVVSSLKQDHKLSVLSEYMNYIVSNCTSA